MVDSALKCVIRKRLMEEDCIKDECNTQTINVCNLRKRREILFGKDGRRKLKMITGKNATGSPTKSNPWCCLYCLLKKYQREWRKWRERIGCVISARINKENSIFNAISPPIFNAISSPTFKTCILAYIQICKPWKWAQREPDCTRRWQRSRMEVLEWMHWRRAAGRLGQH